MAMLKFGHAAVVNKVVCPGKWVDNVVPKGRIVVAKNVVAQFDPSKWLLSHVTIMASVDVDRAIPSDPKSNYLIKPEYSIFVNNNGDSWERNLLKTASKSFLGADNFVEHVQIPELSKGKIIDVALREVPFAKAQDGSDLTSLYVDILIATNKKHTDLVEKIKSGEYSAVSMGCFLAGTEITVSDGTKVLIEDILPGDSVITHTGKVGLVSNVQRRYKKENIFRISFEGDYKPVYVTKEHPFWAFNKNAKCACGCGEDVHYQVRGGKKDFRYSQYKKGHFSRIKNPNNKVLSFNPHNVTPSSEKLKLKWIEAKDLQVDDFLSYPISYHSIIDNNATIDRARLLGYFAAEGSYVKEVFVEGEENDYSVRCAICGGLYNNLAAHICHHKISVEEYRKLYPNSKLKAKKNHNFIKEKRSKDLKDIGLNKIRKDVGIEFSLGSHEYDTLNREIAEISTRLFPEASILRYKNAIKIMSNDAASFMREYCGEYSNKKKFNEKVLFWPTDIQKHLIATWFIGDYACTTSKDLSDQFRFILSRCKIRFNTYKEEAKPYQCSVTKVANGSDVSTVNYSGIRQESYLHQINIIGMNRLSNELCYSFDFKNKKLVDKPFHNINSYSSYEDGYFLRKIKSIEEIPYEGYVHNFEVDGDNSYIANDVAVHNCLIKYSICTQCGRIAEDESQSCKHVKYFKGNYFYDDNGIKRVIAELCGSVDDPESCKFIDGSWVRKPAFEGAVLHKVLPCDFNVSEKIQKAVAMPGFEYSPGMYLKAASQTAREIVRDLEAAEGDAPAPPKDDFSFPEAPAEADKPLSVDTPPVDAPPAEGEAPADSLAPAAPGGDLGGLGGAPGAAPEPQIQEPKEDATVNEVKDMVKRQLLNKMRKDLMIEQAKQEGEDSQRPTDDETSTNDNLVSKSAGFSKILASAKSLKNDRLYNGLMILSTIKDWKQFKKYGYTRDDVLGILHFIDKNATDSPVGQDAVKTLSRVKLGSTGMVPFFTSMIVEIGRKPSRTESKKLASWVKILSQFE